MNQELTKCPKCNSENVKELGPYARRKAEGQPAHRGSDEIYYFCWDCEHEWNSYE